MNKLIIAIVACAGIHSVAVGGWHVEVNPAVEKGPIKLMNAVNNGPTKPRIDQSRGNFDEYAALEIPYARVHDANHSSTYGGPHVVDISAVFPNWEADETKPENYDFHLTDEYLSTMRAAGTQVFYRLGQSIEHLSKKYHVHPPKDFAKWARICEHIVRHYNEGWANGYKWGIEYWEIWNEADLRTGPNSPCWTGTKEQFFDLYKVASSHLRKCFGNTIKIGGPAFCSSLGWIDEFLTFVKKENLPLDFYSWHCYFADARLPSHLAREVRKKLDQHGFTKTENHLNEWNYVKGWTDAWVYTLECETGRLHQKGAAAIAAVMIDCQNAPLDMLMFYDARVACGMNNIFHQLTLRPLKGYYPFVAWRNLKELGTQIEAKIVKAGNRNELYACAAKNAEGKMGLFIARFHDDNNIVETKSVKITVPKGVKVDWKKARCHVTDNESIYTETRLILNKDGSATVKLQPLSFAFIEF